MTTGNGFKSHVEHQRQLEKISTSSTPLLSAGRQKAPPVTEIEMIRVEALRLMDRFNALVEKTAREMMIKALDDAAALEAKQMEQYYEAAPKPWPQVGDMYWCVCTDGIVTALYWDNGAFDIGAFSFGNVFRTEQDAKDERDRRKIMAIMREMADDGRYSLGMWAGKITTTDLLNFAFEFSTYRFTVRERAQACLDRIVEMLSECGIRDGMARLLELWVAKSC